jgi:hypothetical protein
VVDLLGPPAGEASGCLPQLVFTSERLPAPALARALTRYAFRNGFDTPALPA